ncbi:hypothetical protein NMY22_g1422 [Coprinellus aureogranulatus]|nr:hypothetical protein NMY22_g1422 [Coprinellus aureogranulatus]
MELSARYLQLAKLSGFSPIITTASLRHEGSLKAIGATHVFDRNKHLMDAISTPETQRQGFDILAPGGKQVLVLPAEEFWKEEGERQEKTALQVYGSKAFPEHVELLKELWANFTELLEKGLIKPHNVEVLPNGLNGIPDGLTKSEEGKVSNTKLVAHPQETV